MPDWKVCKMHKLGDRSFTENKRIYILKIAQRRENFEITNALSVHLIAGKMTVSNMAAVRRDI